ncbi:MAG: DUF4012 domain-containing protein [Candidatus Kerfeldbacteria bacterium]|nr:DUF4012 domain-containing protein [Candidatus Kerfeldbacteria bacterium]
MKKYSPNLKPNKLHNHSDAAERLGVPSTNILDLRQTQTIPEITVEIQAEPVVEPAVQTVPVITTIVEVADVPAEVVAVEEMITVQAIPEVAKLEPIKPVKTKETNRTQFSTRSFHFAWRPMLAFAVIAALTIVPATTIALWQKAATAAETIATLTGEAADDFQRGAEATSDLQFDSAATSFADAKTSFETAQDQLASVNTALVPVLRTLPATHNPYVSAENLLVVGEQLAGAGEDMAFAFTLVQQLGLHADTMQPSDMFVAAHSAFRPVLPRLQRASVALQAVDVSTVPAEYRDAVRQVQTTVPVVTSSVEQLLSLSESLVTLLGHDETKRYLVLFQNNRELRATGGFIGSFALVDISHGRVSSIEIPGGGPYDLMGNLTEQVVAPQPLHLVNSKWQLQDANWWPDWPTSAKKVQWFYQHSGGASVDGVITLTPDIIEQMLDLTGPIEMPEYNTVVDSSNFYDITQAQAERKYDDTRESKKFIADMTPRLLDKLFSVDAKTLLPVMQVVYDGLEQKDILLYFNDPYIQHEFSERGWTGELKATAGDYLEVVDTNIGGGKTDAAIQQTIHHQADISADGSVVDTVTITRLHTGTSADQFANVNNIDYLRLYVPAGSELITAEGFTQPEASLFLPVEAGYTQDADLATVTGEVVVDGVTQTRVSQEFGKTVFGNWIQTKPGESSTVTVRYRLPFKVDRTSWTPGRYSLFIQKQPGAFDPILLTDVSYPAAWNVVWSYPTEGALTLRQTLQHDTFTGAVFE